MLSADYIAKLTVDSIYRASNSMLGRILKSLRAQQASRIALVNPAHVNALAWEVFSEMQRRNMIGRKSNR